MKYFILICLAFNVMLITSAKADTTVREFQAIAKIASLCKNFKAKGFTSAIITQEDQKEYIPIKEYAKSKNLDINIYNISQLKDVNANLVILSRSISEENQDKVKDYFRNKKVIIASANLQCVKKGKCMIGVEDKSALKILLNGDLYKQSHLQFDRAFQFMVKEI